jgi:DNA polymerase I-like protein with 3'-5' exonuclease and polymerase domains
MTADNITLEDLERDIGEYVDDVAVSAARSSPPPSRPVMKAMHQGNDSALDDVPVFTETKDLAKGWMRYHRLELVLSADKVRELVDRALQVGRVALDTETQGLDTRIEFREDGTPYTHHSIIGYCLGLEGEGYYIPVRHDSKDKHDGQYNVDSVERVEAEIKRLCLESQPVLKEGMVDVLGAKEKDFEIPPRVIIEFWHAKFDQEMLYPITGIDIWSPYSFDDGMLMVYAIDSEAEQGLKENARNRLPPIVDPKTGERHAYEMIEYAQLFAPGTKKGQRKLERLVPRAEGSGREITLYGCSDGICTNLLCKALLPEVQKKASFALFYILEKQVVQVVRIIERTRVLINKGEIASLLQEADEELLSCEKEIKKLAKALGFGDEFNPSSSAQLADLLFGPKGVWKGPKPEKTKEGQYKTDEKTMEVFTKDRGAPEVFTLVLKHRRINKVRGTYLQNLANNTDQLDQLRLNFKPTGAATGRFTAPKGDPEHGYGGIPIQGIPARDDPKKPKVAHSLRRMFIARAGYILAKVDYASQELRIAASTSREPKWIAEYEKELETGEPADLHWLTAQAFYPGLTKDSPDHKLKRGQGKCVHPDTLVATSGGYTPLRLVARFPEEEDSFLETHRPVEIDGSPIVPRILASDWPVEIDGRPVAQTYNGGVKPLVHVVSRRGVVTCTPQHRFLTATGQFTPAGELQKGDLLADVDFAPLPKAGPVTLELKLWKGVPPAAYTVDPDLCYFAGAFLGDGTVCASSARITHGHTDKLDAFDEPYSAWQKLLVDACQRVGIDAEPGTVSVYLGSRVTTRFLSGLELVEVRPGAADGRMKTLRVPLWVRALGEEGFLSFLGGLIDTDGSVSHQFKSIEVTTKDFVFGGQLAALAQAAGLSLSCEATFNRTYNRHYLRLRFSVESSWRLAPYLRYPGKRARLAPPSQRSGMRDTNDVLAVIPAGSGLCLDVTMATEEHVYRANGVLTHNTANFALIYGGGVGAVQRATGCDKVEGARMKSAFDQSVPVFSKWVRGQKEYVKKHLGVTTAFGRFISIPDSNLSREEVIRRLRKTEASKKNLNEEQANELKFSETVVGSEVNKGRASAERKATNYPIQGAGADILKISLVRLVREFNLRGWLRNGGDDSVRIIMTVHDEIVFEIREERVAEAMPVIIQIMESPARLVNWKVPLVAEAELGPSWAAKLNWAKIVKGEEPRPSYLEGAELNPHAPVIVLGGTVAQSAAPRLAPVPPPAAVAPSPLPAPVPPPAAVPSVAPAPVAPRPPSSNEVKPTGPARPRKIATFKLRRLHVDRKTALSVAGAMAAAKIEGIRLDQPEREMLIEVVVEVEGQQVLLYSADEGYRVHVQELAFYLNHRDLLESWEEREELVAHA